MKNTENGRNSRFTLVLAHHRLWGILFLPYIVTNSPSGKYYLLSECLSPYPSEGTLKNLENEEIELVRLANEYSDRPIYKLFSKDKSVKEFLENVTKDKIDKFIRPYIESRLKKCFSIIKDEGTLCFISRSHSNIVHPEDQLEIMANSAIPVFRFERNSEACLYKLKIESEGKKIDLYHNNIDILCNKPCIIRYDNSLLLIKDIDGQKLKPFLTKESLIIPKSTELKYFSGFVLNAVNNYKTEGTGFKIYYPEAEKKAEISLENSIRGYPILILSFYYSGRQISPDDDSEYFSSFENNNGDFIYNKYRRDFIWEKQCRDLLYESGFETDDSVNFYCQSDDLKPVTDIRTVIEKVNRSYENLTKEGFIIRTRYLEKDFNLKPVNIEIINRKEEDWFDLQAKILIGEWQFPFIRFKRHILSDIREFELPDGTTAILPAEWFTKYRSLFEFGKDHNGSIKIHKQHFSLLSEILKEEGNELFRSLEKLLIPEKLPVPETPEGFLCDMRQYQYEGLAWLQWLRSSGLGGCLADDMGLGKTIQTLALLQDGKEKSNNKILTSLIIVPPTIINNWENEIKKFVPAMKIYRHKGVQRERDISNFHHHDIILSSYHTVRQDIDLFINFRFNYIILDESQYIKNPSSQIYKCITRLKSEYKLVLTGTPVENSITDLWAQLNFVNPGLLGTLTYFRREFAKPIEKDYDGRSEIRLKKLIRPFILRRTKEMVASDLPAVTDQTVFCEMTEDQERIYESEKSAVRNLILSGSHDKEKGKAAIVILQGLMKLRQISNHPVMADEDYRGGSGKFETVLNDIENVINEGHKILVFSSFVIHLKLFIEAFEKKAIKFSVLTGASTNRPKIIKSFQNDPSNKVFFISLKTGGVGLNLTSADYVFILDPWWNPAAELQALSRAHRIGQDKNVFVYRYISSGTLEEKIIRLQGKKSKLAESFIATTNPLNDLDMKEILEIIG